MPDEGPPLRIGTAERTAAMQALDDHVAAGRLDIEEYGDRSAQASVATTAPQLAALFVDLPAPHPVLPGVTPPHAPAVAAAIREPAVLQASGLRLMAVMPLLAVALFLLTGHFVFFLLIPMAGALLRSQHGPRPHQRHRY